ncbi:MAG: hypothetical protein A4S15_03035 [Candidatus Raskinella chloraquaticus]|uniref:Uncharacterized protein n=1 Tax=Candidatus Raskinella chloraquaticus TaxID=1951219 RepID=A0A1W9HQG7_9HYPH|nr:MAG: hypothetical protein A4S15_03035 [Proteobacteria bacterium SG_bin8]
MATYYNLPEVIHLAAGGSMNCWKSFPATKRKRAQIGQPLYQSELLNLKDIHGIYMTIKHMYLNLPFHHFQKLIII